MRKAIIATETQFGHQRSVEHCDCMQVVPLKKQPSKVKCIEVPIVLVRKLRLDLETVGATQNSPTPHLSSVSRFDSISQPSFLDSDNLRKAEKYHQAKSHRSGSSASKATRVEKGNGGPAFLVFQALRTAAITTANVSKEQLISAGKRCNADSQLYSIATKYDRRCVVQRALLLQRMFTARRPLISKP